MLGGSHSICVWDRWRQEDGHGHARHTRATGSGWSQCLEGDTERQEAPASGRLAEPWGAASCLRPPASLGLAWGKQSHQRGPDIGEEPAVTEEANAFDDAVKPPRGSHARSSFLAVSRLLRVLEPSLKALKGAVWEKVLRVEGCEERTWWSLPGSTERDPTNPGLEPGTAMGPRGAWRRPTHGVGAWWSVVVLGCFSSLL